MFAPNGILWTLGCSLIAVAPSSSVPGAVPADEPDPTIGWGRRSYDVAELATALEEAESKDVRSAAASALEIVQLWMPWVRSQEHFAFEQSDDARVLLISEQKNRRNKVSKERELVNEACVQFDAFLPPFAPPTSPEGSRVSQEEVTSHLERLDREAIALLFLNDVESMSDALGFLGREVPGLGERLSQVQGLTGLVITEPLVGICLEDVPGVEPGEWKPENEIVHRVSHLLLLRRFGKLPFWIVRGISWHLEYEMTNQVYCFPDRNEFVAEAGHGGWDPRLRSRYRKLSRRVDELDFAEATTWPAGTFDENYAVPSWGIARYFAEAAEPHERSLLLAELHLLMYELGREYEEDRWSEIVGYEPESRLQATVFEKHLGESFLADVMRFFGTGKLR